MTRIARQGEPSKHGSGRKRIQFTDKQAAILAAYFADPDRVKINAFRKVVDCSTMRPKTVWRRCSEIFALDHMKLALSHAVEKVQETAQIDAAWVLVRAGRLANFNISRFIREKDGVAVYDFSNATDEDWYCISEYTPARVAKGVGDGCYEVEKLKIKAYCKLRALELVGKHTSVNAYPHRLEHTGKDGRPIEINTMTDDQLDARILALSASLRADSAT